MRTLRIVLLLVSPALTGGAMLAAQAVERTDVPARGVLRVTFDPRIMTWNDEFTDAGRLKLGAPLTGDTVGGRYIPVVARLEQNVRVASGLAGFVASLGAGLFNVRQERRTYPTTAELGITKRLSVSLMVPMVRVQTRASLQLSNRGANLGVNPLVVNTLGVRGKDSAFFAQFDSALVRLDQQAAGCALPPSPCAARDSSARWRGVRDAELAAKYRLVAGAHYAAALQAVVRLPTGAKDSANELLIQHIGDHQLDLEGRLMQELSVGPLWLNVAVRAATQRPGTQVRRVAPWDAFLVPAAATAD